MALLYFWLCNIQLITGRAEYLIKHGLKVPFVFGKCDVLITKLSELSLEFVVRVLEEPFKDIADDSLQLDHLVSRILWCASVIFCS